MLVRTRGRLLCYLRVNATLRVSTFLLRVSTFLLRVSTFLLRVSTFLLRGGTSRLAPPLAHAPPLHFLTSRALQAQLALALLHPGASLFSKAMKNLEEVRCQLCIFCLAASSGHSSAPVVTWSHH